MRGPHEAPITLAACGKIHVWLTLASYTSWAPHSGCSSNPIPICQPPCT